MKYKQYLDTIMSCGRLELSNVTDSTYMSTSYTIWLADPVVVALLKLHTVAVAPL